MDPKGDELIAGAKDLGRRLNEAKADLAADDEAVGSLQGQIDGLLADIRALAGEKGQLEASVNTAKQDPSGDGRMVAAYLQSMLDELQREEDGYQAEINATLPQLDKAMAKQAQDKARVALLNQGIEGLRQDWSDTHVTPPPF